MDRKYSERRRIRASLWDNKMINQQQWYLYGLFGKHMFAMINIGEQNEKANKSKMYRL